MGKAVINALAKPANARGRKWFRTTAIFFVLMIAFSITAQSDEYLKELEEEASDTGALTKQSKQNKNNPAAENPSNANNATKVKFEKLLEFELPSTYKFYVKLSPQDQDKVVQNFSQSEKMSTASKLIFDLYFESNKK